MAGIKQRVFKQALRAHLKLKNSALYRKLYAAGKYRLTGLTRRADVQARIFCEHYEDSPLAPQTILYESFHASSVSCSPAAIFRAARQDPRFAGFTHVWAIDDSAAVPAEFEGLEDVIVVNRGSDEYPAHLATAGYLINNSTFPWWYLRRSGQVYVNTWHGIPLKTMFRDEQGAPARFANSQRNFLQASHILLAGDYATQHLLGSADVARLCATQTYHIGTPRIDATLAARAAWKTAPARRHVLFAPTWKGHVGQADSQIDEITGLIAALKGLDGPPLTLHVKAHNFNRDDLNMLPQGNDRITVQVVGPLADTNLLMAQMDLVITDYSSLLFDTIAADIPTALFVPDLADYSRDRGLYIALDTLPAAICHDAAALRTAVADMRAPSAFPQDIYRSAMAAYAADEDGRASQRTLAVMLGAPDAPAPIARTAKPVIAIMAGGFKRNGITTSALNLLSNLDQFRHDVVVLTDGAQLSDESWDLVDRVAPGVMKIHRLGSESYTPEEYAAKSHFYSYNTLEQPAELALMERAMRREATRILGPRRLDVAIEFSAYRRMWAWIMAMTDARQKIIYQHNDMQSERDSRFDVLEGVFFTYKYYSTVVSVSENTRALNFKNLSGYYGAAQTRAVSNTLNITATQEAGAVTQAYALPAPDPNATPMDPADFNTIVLDPDAINFVTIGRCSPEKNHTMLLNAFALLHKARPDARLCILGEGPERAATIALCQELGLDDVVHIPGFSEQAMGLLAQADCFVLPSLYEGQPMVILEALTLNKPVIVTDIAGSRGALQGGYGFIAAGTEAAAFATAMEDFCAGRIQFKPFDAKIYNAKAIAEFYDMLTPGEPAA